ncbi:hypothetical protein [Paeniglutamicibacter psychrophenolicus]|uniref:hypothetical protein n=1 Tax=Paeniglutamicibacter psychrophenolicus TaxID=257454 RepID=UPI002789D96D|nr:hypothetical protein [Paeniglutamicibacter psychrophenolicus]MDQ0092220.1 hypothetical protein [Paeniglutamicibacter psychrophenolicus]
MSVSTARRAQAPARSFGTGRIRSKGLASGQLGLTALACVWYFRHTALDSLRDFALRLLAPLLGGIALVAVFIQTAVDFWDPAYGSGSQIFGVGLVFVLGVGIIALGAVFLVGAAARRPEFFSGRSLPRRAPASGRERV